MPPGLSSAQRTALANAKLIAAAKERSRVAATKKKKLGGTAKTISAKAYSKQMDQFASGKRARPPQKKITKGTATPAQKRTISTQRRRGDDGTE